MKTAIDVSVVVPTYRERDNLAELTERLFSSLKEAGLQGELIIVDDDSQDGTIDICRSLAEHFPVRLITRIGERGLATAVIRGLQEAQGECLVVMDADLSHPPEAVPELLRPLQTQQADFVIGSRYVPGGSLDESWGLFRRLNSRVAGWLARGLTTARDPMAGFFSLHRRHLTNLNGLNPCGYKIGLEIMVRCGLSRIVEVPIHFTDRTRGESKLSLKEQGLYLKHLARLYAFRFPEAVRFSTFTAVGISGLVLDMLSFALLAPGVGIRIARAAAIWLAMTWNYELNRSITFRQTETSGRLVQYLKFCGACLFGAMVSWSISVGLIEQTTFFSRHPITAAGLGPVFAAVVNYAACRMWVFRSRPAPASPATAPGFAGLLRKPSVPAGDTSAMLNMSGESQNSAALLATTSDTPERTAA